MEVALHKVGFNWVVLPLHIRAALRSHNLWHRWAVLQRICRVMLVYSLTIIIGINISSPEEHYPTTVIVFFLSFYGGVGTLRAPAEMRQRQLVAECADAIQTAAVAAHAGGNDRAAAMRKVSVNLQAVERAIFRARRSHGTVARNRWSRHAALRRHAERVVATLRAAEKQLDGDRPAAALEHLAGLLLRIAAASAAGHTGKLLPEHLTEPHKDERVRDTELLRIAGVVLLTLAAVGGVAALKIPDIAAVSVIMGVAVLSSIALLGHGWTKALKVIELMKG
ncbi:hypothetical protein [Streptomyces sp. NPDC055085]